jgi:hypothetical protein
MTVVIFSIAAYSRRCKILSETFDFFVYMTIKNRQGLDIGYYIIRILLAVSCEVLLLLLLLLLTANGFSPGGSGTTTQQTNNTKNTSLQ